MTTIQKQVITALGVVILLIGGIVIIKNIDKIDPIEIAQEEDQAEIVTIKKVIEEVVGEAINKAVEEISEVAVIDVCVELEDLRANHEIRDLIDQAAAGTIEHSDLMYLIGMYSDLVSARGGSVTLTDITPSNTIIDKLNDELKK